MKVSPRSIQFNLDGIDFDLLPATNMCYQGQGRHTDTVKTQNENMLDKIRRAPNPFKAAKDNSAGLTEAAVEFVKRQSTFAHKAARLAKFWNSTLMYDGYISGR